MLTVFNDGRAVDDYPRNARCVSVRLLIGSVVGNGFFIEQDNVGGIAGAE